MRLTVAAVAMLLTAPAWAQQVAPSRVKPIPHQRFDIDYSLQGAAADRVELWYTDSRGESWNLYGLDPDRTSPITFTAPKEGLYGFYIIARNRKGPSAPDPVAGTAPMFWCFIDWHAPLVQILGPTPVMPINGGDGVGQVRLQPNEPLTITYSVSDDHLEARPIYIEYRLAQERTWQTIARAEQNTGRYLWSVPAQVNGAFFLRVRAVDQARNYGVASSKQMRIERIQRPAPPEQAGGVDVAPPTSPESGQDEPERAAPTPPAEPGTPEGNQPASISPPRSVDPERAPSEPTEPTAAAGRGTEPTPATHVPDRPAPTVGPTVAVAQPGPGPDVASAQPEPTRMEQLADREALGMFVIQFSNRPPMKTSEFQPALQQMVGAMNELVERKLVRGPVGMTLERSDDSKKLVKGGRLYAIIPVSQRTSASAGAMTGIVSDRLSETVAGGTVWQPLLEKAPVPAGDETTMAAAPSPTPPTPSPAAPEPAPSSPEIVAVPEPTTTATPEPTTAVAPEPTPTVAPEPAPTPSPEPTISGPTSISPPVPVDSVEPSPGTTESTPATTVTPPLPEPAGPSVATPSTPSVPEPSPEIGPGSEQPAKVATTPDVERTPATATVDQPVKPSADLPEQPRAGRQEMDFEMGSRGPGITIQPAETPAPQPAGPAVVAQPTEIVPPAPAPASEPAPGVGDEPTPTPAPTPTPEHVVTEPDGPRPSAPQPQPSQASVSAPKQIDEPEPSKPAPAPVSTGPSAEQVARGQDLFRQAVAQQAQGNFNKAADFYHQAIKANPQMVQAHVNLAGLKFLQKDYVAAEIYYRQALGVDAKRTSALFGLGRVQLLRGNAEEAQTTLGRLLAADPNDAAGWVLYGDAAVGSGSTAEAVKAWRKAADLTGSGPIHDAAQKRISTYGG